MIVEKKEKNETFHHDVMERNWRNCENQGQEMQSSVSTIELLNNSLENSSLVGELRKQLENSHHQIRLLQKEYEFHILQMSHHYEVELLKKNHTIELLQRDLNHLSDIRKVEYETQSQENHFDIKDLENQKYPINKGIELLQHDIETLQTHIIKLIKK